MAPPRQRPPLNSVLGGVGAGDDSRSEASSTATGGPTSRGVPGPKPRKSGVASSTSGAATTGTLASAKELKVAAATGATAAAAAASGLGQQDIYGLDGLRDDLPGVCSYRTPYRCCGRANGFSMDRYHGIKCPSQSCTITDTRTNSLHQAHTHDRYRRYISPLALVFAPRRL